MEGSQQTAYAEAQQGQALVNAQAKAKQPADAKAALDAKPRPGGRVGAIGDNVHVVHGWPGRDDLMARITRVGGGGHVDLLVDDGRDGFALTSSPHDPAGKLSDSWHFAD